MSKVYITNASLNLISKSLRNKIKNISRDVLLSDISEDFSDELLSKEKLNEMMNTFELKDIYLIKGILKNFDDLLLSIQENQNMIINYIKVQNTRYAFEIKQPA